MRLYIGRPDSDHEGQIMLIIIIIQCAANISVLISRVDELANPLKGFSLDHRKKQLSGTCECSG